MQPSTKEAGQGSTGFYTSFSYQGFVLVGVSLVLFEVLFLILYVDSFWMACDLLPWGIPAVVCVVVLGHFLLLWLESPSGCRSLSWFFKKRPALIYRQWITFDEVGIMFGSKRILWRAIDEVELSLFGNLVFRSRCICGPARVHKGKETNPSDILVKIPFSPLSMESQRQFLDLLKRQCANVSLNARLTKQATKGLIKGNAWAQALAVVFLAFALIDLGYSGFRQLELLKQYFLCEKEAIAGTADSALEHFKQAEAIKSHPSPISWISRRVMVQGTIAAGIEQARSQALWALGRQEESLAVAKVAVELAQKSFSYRLRLARLYAVLGMNAQAEEEIKRAIDLHKDALMPRLYLLSTLITDGQRTQAAILWSNYMKQVTETVFGPPPAWPPGSPPFLHELFYKDDLDFIFERLVGRN